MARSRKGRWTPEQAQEWYLGQPWLMGCNYTPRSAINQLEMWQADTFKPQVIKQELTWAAGIGMNTVRIFLHDLCWEQDAKGFLKRIDQVLSIADKLGIGAMVVFFDSVWHPFPQLGKQREPEKGVHNSGWVQSPGLAVLRDDKAFGRLKGYVTGVMKHFADDPRVQVWDVWNEPDNSNAMSYGPRDAGGQKPELAAKWLPAVFEWARSARASQPITCGVWAGDWSSTQTLKPHETIQVENSDVISFHCYGPPDDMARRIEQLQQYGRPLLCTEYMSRGSGSTFQGVLPVLKKHQVAAYCWGLVEGKTQTIYPWDSWQKPYPKEPKPWFHDVFRADGTPYNRAEVRVIESLAERS